MNRREFIRTLATTTLAGLALIGLPVIRASASLTPSRGYFRSIRLRRTFQGTVDGRILERADLDQTWQQVISFGGQYEIHSIVERQGNLFAELGFQGYSFFLKSQDGRLWLTTASIPAA